MRTKDKFLCMFARGRLADSLHGAGYGEEGCGGG